jgi:hypothetical protein
LIKSGETVKWQEVDYFSVQQMVEFERLLCLEQILMLDTTALNLVATATGRSVCA